MTAPYAQQGGSFNAHEGMLNAAQDVAKIGGMSQMNLLHMLAVLFHDADRDQPREGFIGDGFLPEAGSGALDLNVQAGIGFQWDGTFSNPFGADYKPVVLPAVQTHTFVRPGTSTHARIDVLSAQAGIVEDQPGVRQHKDVSTGMRSTKTFDLRALWSTSVTITEGTPATSPVAPSTPAGHIKIGEVYIPSSSSGGSIIIRDHRQRISHLGSNFSNDPGQDYQADWVPGSGSELATTPDVGLAVQVEGGAAVLGGQRNYYGTTVLGLAAAPTTSGLHRWDAVWVQGDGTMGVEQGSNTVSTINLYPTPPSGSMAVAYVNVAYGASTLSSGDITDLRVRQPYSGELLRDRTVAVEKLEEQTGYFDVSMITSGSGYVEYALQLRDLAGNALAREQYVEVVLLDGDMEQMDPLADARVDSATSPKGSFVSTSAKSRVLLLTDTDGRVDVRIQRVAGSTISVLMRMGPTVWSGGDRHAGHPTFDSFSV